MLLPLQFASLIGQRLKFPEGMRPIEADSVGAEIAAIRVAAAQAQSDCLAVLLGGPERKNHLLGGGELQTLWSFFLEIPWEAFAQIL